MKAAIECPRGMWIESTAAKTPDGMEVMAASLRRAHRENQDVVLVSDSGECAMVVDGMGAPCQVWQMRQTTRPFSCFLVRLGSLGNKNRSCM